MKGACCLTLLIAALSVTGCGESTSAQDALGAADEAHALAQQANDRADALEAELEDLRTELQNEAAYREGEDAELENDIRSHYHY